MIVGVTGKRLSGKNEVAEHLRGRYGFHILDITDEILRPTLKKQGKEVNRENLASLAMEMRKKGNDILVIMLCKKILPGKNYVIPNIRFPEEANYLRKKFGKGFALISLEVSTKERFRRIRTRGDPKDVGLTMRRFLETEKLATETPISKAMKLADFRVKNTGTKDRLRKAVDRIMERVLKG
jgi:dephospho-CoA kinase